MEKTKIVSINCFPVFVSPELSSGRDIAIQMSVRRPVSAVCIFLSRAFLGNCMFHLDDIWYVGGARAEGVHAEFWACHMLDPWGQKY